MHVNECLLLGGGCKMKGKPCEELPEGSSGCAYNGAPLLTQEEWDGYVRVSCGDCSCLMVGAQYVHWNGQCAYN